MTTGEKKEYGNCYEAAGKLFMDLSYGSVTPFSPTFGEVRLVHGRPTLTVSPYRKYGHAWLEVGDSLCFDAERETLIPKGLFYSAGTIDPDECFYYDYGAFSEKIREFKHWGPWEGVEATTT